MERPARLEPGQLWLNTLGSVVLVLKHGTKKLAVANLNPPGGEFPFVVLDFEPDEVNINWVYVGMLNEKVEQ